MISKTEKPRDKAFIAVAVAFDGGFRIGEMLNIRLGDVNFDENGARVRVNGKTGPRVVRFVTAAPLLSSWVSRHPLETIRWKGKLRALYLRHELVVKEMKQSGSNTIRLLTRGEQ
jgi:integrase